MALLRPVLKTNVGASVIGRFRGGTEGESNFRGDKGWGVPKGFLTELVAKTFVLVHIWS
jgi:hypothetical protein